MGQCRYCGRSGWLLAVDSAGLCSSCRPAYELTLSGRARVIQESQKLVEASAKLETRLSRCDVIIEHAHGLFDYEAHGIPTITPPPSQLIQATIVLKDQLMLDAMRAEVVAARRKADVAPGAKGKISALTKALLMVREYKTKTSGPGILNAIERDLEAQLHRIQLDGYLDEAKKAEFKGNKKKALDQYYEALYYLKHDSVTDARQAEQIAWIEAKIAELGGAPPS